MIDEHLISTIFDNSTWAPSRKIISVGLLIRRKRHDLVIRALAEPELDDCQLKIVGDGPEEKALQRLAKELGVADRVDFLGLLTHAEALAEIANASCLVLASDSEGAPWTVAEGQTLGVPVVVRAGTGAESLVNLTQLGTIVSADVQPPELALALDRSLRSRVLPTKRWNRSRLPDSLLQWYDLE